MPDERFDVALARIGAALSRVEEIVLAAPSAEPSDLVRRHDRLRADTAAAIERIDRLLADTDI